MSNPSFAFIVLLALCMPSHITPIFNLVYKIKYDAHFLFIPCFNQIHLIGFYFVTRCFNIFTRIKTRVLSQTLKLIPDEGPLLETSNLFGSLIGSE